MSGMQSLRNTAAGFAIAVSAVGTTTAQEPTALTPPLYGASPVDSNPAVPSPPASSVMSAAECAQPAECEHRPATWWERYNYRKWEKKRRMQECFLGYPEEFCEQPLGAALYSQMNTQVANGIAAKLVLYQFDFVQGSDQLNDKGKERLARHIALMNVNFYPLTIEPTPEAPRLAELRRVAVLQAMYQMQATSLADRVVVGTPTALGLQGRQAILLDVNLLRDTKAGGTTNLAPGSFRAGGLIQGAGTSGGGNYGNAGTGFTP